MHYFSATSVSRPYPVLKAALLPGVRLGGIRAQATRYRFVCRSPYSAVLSESRSGPWSGAGKTRQDGSILVRLRKRIWCGRRELNPHGLAACGFSYHFGFRRPASDGFVVWTIPSPFPAGGLGAARLVSTPSRKRFRIWLGIAISGFPDFEQFYAVGFPMGTQPCLSPLRLPFRHARGKLAQPHHKANIVLSPLRLPISPSGH